MAGTGYRDIAAQLRARIESGELAAGAEVPSEAELAAEHGVSRTTARRALVSLTDDGLIGGGAGRVRFVCSGERLASARYEQVAEELRAVLEGRSVGQLVGTEGGLAERFGVSPGTVRRALQDLEDAGLVTGIHGRGWFVGAEDPTRAAETAGTIRAEVSAGRWSVGAHLPGERALAGGYGVGRVTVRRALAILEAEGVLGRRPGGSRVVLRRKPDPSAEWWTTSDVAAYIEVNPATFSSYRNRGKLNVPEPKTVGRTHMWRPEVIIAWHAARPRPGVGGRPAGGSAD